MSSPGSYKTLTGRDLRWENNDSFDLRLRERRRTRARRITESPRSEPSDPGFRAPRASAMSFVLVAPSRFLTAFVHPYSRSPKPFRDRSTSYVLGAVNDLCARDLTEAPRKPNDLQSTIVNSFQIQNNVRLHATEVASVNSSTCCQLKVTNQPNRRSPAARFRLDLQCHVACLQTARERKCNTQYQMNC